MQGYLLWMFMGCRHITRRAYPRIFDTRKGAVKGKQPLKYWTYQYAVACMANDASAPSRRADYYEDTSKGSYLRYAHRSDCVRDSAAEVQDLTISPSIRSAQERF